MNRNKRKFSQEERLEILREAEQQGIEATLRKHNLSRSLYPFPAESPPVRDGG